MQFRLGSVVGVLGALMFFLGIALLAPAVVAWMYDEAGTGSFALPGLLSMLVGGAFWFFLRPKEDLRAREGFAIVALTWLILSLVGALPFVLSGVLSSYTDAFFETMSGLTTTGATILGGATTPAIEDLPRAFLFWRSLSQWLGGMGIIVLTLAVLPLLGVGGMQLFKAEVSGPTIDKLTPRVTETARRLWVIYIGFTAIQTLLLMPVMGLFEAVNHAFTTMATGGYSTRNGSIADFQSAYVEWVIVVFMFLAGVSFALHFRLFRSEGLTVFRNSELRLYAGIVVIGTTLAFLNLFFGTVGLQAGHESLARLDGFSDAFRAAAFQVVSIVTTTGFGTSDYSVWPPLAMGVIFALFFVGGMAGSTGGGIKVIRLLLLFKNASRSFNQLIHPRAVIPLRFDGKVVSADVWATVTAFFTLYLGMILLGTLVLAVLGMDLVSAFSASFSSAGNVGPAFGTVGPVDNYAHVHPLGKWLLALMMMVGRLEVFTVLILFVPAFWRK
jgi:trk system potassium uptake protein